MSTSEKPVSLDNDGSTYILGLKTTRGMFGALSTTEIDDHSHSEFKGDKCFRSINECYRSPQHQECGAYCDGGIRLGQDIT